MSWMQREPTDCLVRSESVKLALLIVAAGIMTLGYIAAFSETLAKAIELKKGVIPLKVRHI